MPDRPWRTGRSVHRTVYRQRGADPAKGDDLIGLMDTRELAAQVVEAVNERTDAAAELERMADGWDRLVPELRLRGRDGLADGLELAAGRARERAVELRGGPDSGSEIPKGTP